MTASSDLEARGTVSAVTSGDSPPSQAKPDYIDSLIKNPVEAFTPPLLENKLMIVTIDAFVDSNSRGLYESPILLNFDLF